MYDTIIQFIRNLYGHRKLVPLHEPLFIGSEKKYLVDCIDSTFVSSVGKYVGEFEKKIKEYTGAGYAVATVNGTCALHLALKLADVKLNDLVITQPLSFIATSNAISYCGALPLFIDVDKETMGLSPVKLSEYLQKNAVRKKDGFCYHQSTGQRIAACVPMHTFGHPAKMDEINRVCKKFNIVLIEDAAEAIGSRYKGKHAGTLGVIGVLSFNGNKIITTGGGGMILTDDEAIAKKAKHRTTQAKVPHPWEFAHDEIGFNYRLPNINAALGCAQMEQLDLFIANKRKLALGYKKFFDKMGIPFFTEPENCKSNYWLNSIFLKSRKERDEFLQFSNKNGVMTRPAWTLTNKLIMYKTALTGNLDNAQWIEDHLVNIPSSVIS